MPQRLIDPATLSGAMAGFVPVKLVPKIAPDILSGDRTGSAGGCGKLWRAANHDSPATNHFPLEIPIMMPVLSPYHAWVVLGIAILFELGGTTSMRLSEGFTRITPSVLIFAFYAVSFVLNTMVIRTLGLSVVYAVWSGVGTVLTALVGYLYFKEPATALKIGSTLLIVAGVLGLHNASRAS